VYLGVFELKLPYFGISVDTIVDKAMRDLDWTPKYNMLDGLKDSYEKDFKIKKVSPIATY
jgi:hypothetical protein